MAKKDRRADAERDTAHPKTLLDAAADALERGDVVFARRAAKQAMALTTPTKAEEAAARRIGALWWGEAGKNLEPTVANVARELVSRTGVPTKPLIFSAISAGIFLFLLALAHFRT